MTSHEVKSEGFSSGFSSSEAPVKREYSGDEVGTAEEGGLSDPNHVDLHRALKARHITMIGTSKISTCKLRDIQLTRYSHWWCNWNWSDHWYW
jgi:hypothetical protein